MSRSLWIGVVLFGAAGGLVAGCAGKQDAAGAGQACYRDEDCKAGLVCVADSGGNRVCSNDVSSLASTVDGPPPPPDAGMAAAGAGQ